MLFSHKINVLLLILQLHITNHQLNFSKTKLGHILHDYKNFGITYWYFLFKIFKF